MLIRCLVILLVAGVLPGCNRISRVDDTGQPPPPPPQPEITVLVPYQSPWAETMRAPLLLNRAMSTGTDRVLSAVTNGCTFEAMFGPLSLNTPNSGQVIPTTNSSNEPVLTVQSGYAFLIGRWPRVVSKWAQGAASGTEMLIQIDTSTSSVETHRVFLLDYLTAQKITVVAVNPTTGAPILPGVDIVSEGYVEVTMNVLSGLPQVAGPFPLTNAPASVTTFVADIKRRAAHQGLLPYPTSP